MRDKELELAAQPHRDEAGSEYVARRAEGPQSSASSERIREQAGYSSRIVASFAVQTLATAGQEPVTMRERNSESYLKSELRKF